MTTKARIAALQWFHDRGAIEEREAIKGVGISLIRRMVNDGQIEAHPIKGGFLRIEYTLTDKGRQDLHEATK